jgi:hypothetical protein
MGWPVVILLTSGRRRDRVDLEGRYESTPITDHDLPGRCGRKKCVQTEIILFLENDRAYSAGKMRMNDRTSLLGKGLNENNEWYIGIICGPRYIRTAAICFELSE